MLKMQLPGRGDQGSTRVNDILHQFPFSLPYSGFVNGASGATVDQGTSGGWWSAGSDSSTYARSLNIYGNYTYPEYLYYKTRGFSVRCVGSGDQGSTRVNDILHQFPFSLPYSGYVDSFAGDTANQGTNGRWWSQGANSGTNARGLYISGNYTSPEGNYYKTHGFSVRCVVFYRAW